METSAREWEEHVRRGGTVPRAPVSRCPVLQEPTLIGWTPHILHKHIPIKLTLLFYYVCDVWVVAVFIWQMPLAVVRVQRVSSVAPRVSRVRLDCVRQDFTVQGETQQPQVEQENIELCLSDIGKVTSSITPLFLQDKSSLATSMRWFYQWLTMDVAHTWKWQCRAGVIYNVWGEFLWRSIR